MSSEFLNRFVHQEKDTFNPFYQQQLGEKVKADVARFLENGGQVTQIPAGVSAVPDPTEKMWMEIKNEPDYRASQKANRRRARWAERRKAEREGGIK